jgi:hypothetical protein
MIRGRHTVDNCKLIDLPKIHNSAGNITVIQNGIHLPFDVKRVYYLYDVPGGSERGGHAHKELYQLIVAASGSFSVLLFDGETSKKVFLSRPNVGLMVVPGIWEELVDFSSGAVCLVLASEKFNANDYLRNYPEYLCTQEKREN